MAFSTRSWACAAIRKITSGVSYAPVVTLFGTTCTFTLERPPAKRGVPLAGVLGIFQENRQFYTTKTMEAQKLIDQTIAFVQTTLSGAEAGHDWAHTRRVWKNAELIARHEAVDPLVVALAALLHDIADAKFHQGDEEVGPRKARAFLESLPVEATIVDHVEQIVRHISFKGGNFTRSFHSPELAVVQDADRLDAIGAIGIARAFHYGGYRNRELHNPDIAPNLNMSKEEYKNSAAPTINHFYEKLLLLKDRMNTPAGRRLAEQRHRYMEGFLEQFLEEWDGRR